MNVFDKRPLSLILCILVGGFVVFSLSDSIWKNIIPLLALVIFLITVPLLAFKKKRGTKLMIATTALLLVCTTLFSDCYFQKYFKAEQRYTDEVVAVAIIEKIEEDDFGIEAWLDIISINGAYENYHFVADIENDLSNLISRGDQIQFIGRITGLGDQKSYYYQSGVSSRISITDLKITSRDNKTPRMLFSDFREYLFRRAAMQSDGQSGNILSALLLGDRDRLPDEIVADFKALGITHLLALSGLHIAILTTGVEKLLRLLGVGKKSRSLISIFFTLLYMALTGFSSSVMRAGIMLIISYALFLISRSHDSITSLSLSVTIIIIIAPHSIYDLSLWLSAFATLGIILLSEAKIYKRKSKSLLLNFLYWIGTSLLTSIFAIIAILPFSMALFPSFSLLAPLATLIFSFLCELIMYIGGIMLIVGDFIPLGHILTPISEAFVKLLSSMADIPNIVVSMNSEFLQALAIIPISLFFLFMLLNIRHKKVAISIISLSFLMFLGIVAIENYNAYKTDDIIYCSAKNSDALIIKSDGAASIIDSSNFSVASSNAWCNALEKERLLDIQNYIPTHYSRRLPDAAEIMMQNLKIQRIVLPAPANSDENEILEELISVCEKYRVSVISALSVDSTYTIGQYQYTPRYISNYGDDTSATIFTLRYGNNSLLYLSCGLLVGNTKAVAIEEIERSDSLILGVHGPKYTTTRYISDEYKHIRQIILGSDDLFFTQKSLKFYHENGCKIYSHPDYISLLNIE